MAEHLPLAPSTSSSSPSSRQDLLHNAVLFLTDPKVASSSLTSKIQFLEGKGLDEAEIQEALRRANGSSASSSSLTGVPGTSAAAIGGSGSGSASGAAARRDMGYEREFGYGINGGRQGYEYGYGLRVRAPEPPRRDWRDLFVSALMPVQDEER